MFFFLVGSSNDVDLVVILTFFSPTFFVFRITNTRNRQQKSWHQQHVWQDWHSTANRCVFGCVGQRRMRQEIRQSGCTLSFQLYLRSKRGDHHDIDRRGTVLHLDPLCRGQQCHRDTRCSSAIAPSFSKTQLGRSTRWILVSGGVFCSSTAFHFHRHLTHGTLFDDAP